MLNDTLKMVHHSTYLTEVIVDEVNLLDKKKDTNAASMQPDFDTGIETSITDDDIPF